jgi:hypothetical protein
MKSCDVMLAWLDGAQVDDGTACEIGIFSEWVRWCRWFGNVIFLRDSMMSTLISLGKARNEVRNHWTLYRSPPTAASCIRRARGIESIRSRSSSINRCSPVVGRRDNPNIEALAAISAEAKIIRAHA